MGVIWRYVRAVLELACILGALFGVALVFPLAVLVLAIGHWREGRKAQCVNFPRVGGTTKENEA
jgi:hypothetical protein